MAGWKFGDGCWTRLGSKVKSSNCHPSKVQFIQTNIISYDRNIYYTIYITYLAHGKSKSFKCNPAQFSFMSLYAHTFYSKCHPVLIQSILYFILPMAGSKLSQLDAFPALLMWWEMQISLEEYEIHIMNGFKWFTEHGQLWPQVRNIASEELEGDSIVERWRSSNR